MENVKIYGIKKAVSGWNATRNIAARVYYNRITGFVWCKEYPSLSSWTNYDSHNVVEILNHDSLNFYKLTMKELKAAIIDAISE